MLAAVQKERSGSMMPRVFVGCASESRSIAYAIQQNLEYDANITVWTQGIFQLSYSTIERLLRTLKDQDFGIFILEPQDLLLLRGQEYQVPRDNVILEVGLFIGALGRARTFLFVPRSQEALHLPTDLLGMTPATFNADRSDLQGALGSACTKILQEIARLGPSD